MGDWIPVSERLPEHGGTVVCVTKQRELRFGRVMTVTEHKGGTVAKSHLWMGYPDGTLEVTHWAALPGPVVDSGRTMNGDPLEEPDEAADEIDRPLDRLG